MVCDLPGCCRGWARARRFRMDRSRRQVSSYEASYDAWRQKSGAEVLYHSLSGCRRAGRPVQLARQRAHISRNELDQVGLALGASLLEHVLQVRLDGGFGDAEHRRDLGHAADLHDHHQNTHLGWSQLVSIGDGFERMRQVEFRLANENPGGSPMRNTPPPPGPPGEGPKQ